MSFWQIFGRLAVSDEGETIQRVSDTTSVSSNGTTYTKMGSITVGSDGSVFTQMGSFSTDGSTRMGSTAMGPGTWSLTGVLDNTDVFFIMTQAVTKGVLHPKVY